MRYLWRTFFEEDPELEVVGEARDGRAAIAGVCELKPDVLVLGLSMPEMDGLEVLGAVQNLAPETSVVVASGFARSRMANRALQLGAAAYIEKREPSEKLCDAVRSAYANERHHRWSAEAAPH